MGILRGRGSIKRKMKCREREEALGEKWKPLGLQAECLGDKELMSSGSGEKLSSPGEWRRRSRGSTARGLMETTIPLGSTIDKLVYILSLFPENSFYFLPYWNVAFFEYSFYCSLPSEGCYLSLFYTPY